MVCSSKKTCSHSGFHSIIIHDSWCTYRPAAIDMESYEMESPELTAQTIIKSFQIQKLSWFCDFGRDPELFHLEDWSPVPPMSDGAPDYSSLPDVGEMVESGEAWQGISAPKGGIVNLSVLREIDAKRQLSTTIS